MLISSSLCSSTTPRDEQRLKRCCVTHGLIPPRIWTSHCTCRRCRIPTSVMGRQTRGCRWTPRDQIRSDPDRFELKRFDVDRSNLERSGLVLPDLDRSDLPWPDLDRSGLLRPRGVTFGLIWCRSSMLVAGSALLIVSNYLLSVSVRYVRNSVHY